jgi:HEAT repeats
MGTRRRIAIWVAGAAAGIGLFYFVWPREPVYQGKRLTVWLEHYHTNYRGGWTNRAQAQEATRAQEAIRRIGTNAVPLCLRLIKTRESAAKVKLFRLVPASWLDRLHIPGLNQYRDYILRCQDLGVDGFEALGEEAKPAVPALVGLLREKDGQTRHVAMFALIRLHAMATEALSELTKCLKDPDPFVRADAIETLGGIDAEPERVVPVLVAVLEAHANNREDWYPTHAAINVLSSFGASAKGAVPFLNVLLDDPKPEVRVAATNALEQIDPEAAGKATAGGK